MDLGDIVAATLAVSICGLLLWVCMGPALFRPFENYGIRKFHRFLASLESHNQDYTYYTTGHLVWSATSIEEIERDIKKLCVYVLFSPASPQPPRFILEVRESSKRVYFVPTSDPDFDWEAIAHYEDYVSMPT